MTKHYIAMNVVMLLKLKDNKYSRAKRFEYFNGYCGDIASGISVHTTAFITTNGNWWHSLLLFIISSGVSIKVPSICAIF